VSTPHRHGIEDRGMQRLPVLWLCGPPGAGKTTAGWEIYSGLRRAGVPAGYADIDQLGMCYPEPASDPGRYHLKARNLAAVLAGHRAAGVRCAVVSGVLDATGRVPVGDLPGAAVTVCRLRAGADDLARRITERDGAGTELPPVLREAAALDAGCIGDVCVDTTGLPVAEVVRRIRQRLGDWPGPLPTGPTAPAPPPGPDPGCAPPVLWLCGVTGVGKSTAGFLAYQRALRAGLSAAYLDLDQLGFGADGHRVKARNAAAVWRNFRQAGARLLVMTGPAADADAVAAYAEALPPGTLTVCRLHAGRDELTRRILSRGRGGSWSQPGDPLVGRPVPDLLRVAARAARDAAAQDRAGLGHRVDTDGRTAAEVAEAVVRECAAVIPSAR
jgi:adenylylsulfate kinase-like enzyme